MNRSYNIHKHGKGEMEAMPVTHDLSELIEIEGPALEDDVIS